MDVLLVAVCVVFLVVMGAKAIRGYPAYKGSVYQQLFGSYLEYFWKGTVSQDLSQSGWLSGIVGTHRLGYITCFGPKGIPVAQFVSVFSAHGFVCLCSPVVASADRVPALGRALKEQRAFLKRVADRREMPIVIAVPEEVATISPDARVSVIKVSELPSYLTSMSGTGISEGDVPSAFEAFKKGASHVGR